jgi:hypothetical protein
MAKFDVDTVDYMELLPTIDRQPTKKVVPISIMEIAGDCYCRILFSDESQVFYSPHSQQQMIEWSDISRRNSLALATWRIVPMSALRRVEHAGMGFHDWECRRPTAWSRASHNEAVRRMIQESRAP